MPKCIYVAMHGKEVIDSVSKSYVILNMFFIFPINYVIG